MVFVKNRYLRKNVIAKGREYLTKDNTALGRILWARTVQPNLLSILDIGWPVTILANLSAQTCAAARYWVGSYILVVPAVVLLCLE